MIQAALIVSPRDSASSASAPPPAAATAIQMSALTSLFIVCDVRAIPDLCDLPDPRSQIPDP